MSLSPPLRRLSSTNSSSKESLINAYEAEEERIINILSRKLEKVCPCIPPQLSDHNSYPAYSFVKRKLSLRTHLKLNRKRM